VYGPAVLPVEHDDAAQSGDAGRGGRGSAVVRRRSAAGDERVGTGGHRVRDQPLERASLVAREHEPGEVVALDPDLRPPERSREPLGAHQRRREHG
jgi:hypothetical protein